MSHKTLTLGNLDEPNIDISDDEEYDEPNIDILDDDNLFESDENINYSSEEDDNEENDEVDEHNYEEEDDIPAPTTKSSEELTPCVVMINRNGVIERCGAKNTSNQKRLWNLIGTWEVDTKTVNEMKERTDRLGVCTTHFHYDQNNLHPRGLKQMKSYETGVIRHFRCTLCKKYFRTFCRIYGCDVHCWSFAGKTTQIPCIGQYKCPMVKAFPLLIQKTESARQMQYVCCACYASQGGHLHDQKAMGDDDTECTPNKHAKNARKTVKILGELMLNAAETKDDAFNDRLSKLAAPMLKVFQEPSTTEIELPS
ncbi:9870_t:CDS:1, partial [Paraglomus brasilianum]